MKNRKKLLVVLMSLFILTGIVSYSAYSYFWSSETITHVSYNTLEGFDVELDYGDGEVFISGNYETSLECEHSSEHENKFICSNNISVYDYGQNADIKVYNLNISLSGIDNASITNISSYNMDYDETDDCYYFTGSWEDSFSFYVEVEVPGYVEPGDEVVYLTEGVPNGELEVTLSFDIRATEHY